MQLEAVLDWLTRAGLGIAFSGGKSRSQTTAVIATVLWRGIGASPCSLLFAPTTCLWTLAVRSPSWITTINWNEGYFSWLWIVGAFLTRSGGGGGGGGGAPGKEPGLMVLWVPSFKQDIVLLLSGLLNRVFCMRNETNQIGHKKELFHKQSSEMHVFCLTRSLGCEALAAPTHTSRKCSPWTDLPD